MDISYHDKDALYVEGEAQRKSGRWKPRQRVDITCSPIFLRASFHTTSVGRRRLDNAHALPPLKLPRNVGARLPAPAASSPCDKYHQDGDVDREDCSQKGADDDDGAPPHVQAPSKLNCQSVGLGEFPPPSVFVP